MGVAPAYNPDDVKSGETFSMCGCSLPTSVGKVTLAAEGEIYINLGSKIAPRINTDSTDKVSG